MTLAAINTLPPKSLTNSQKARDRAKREMLNYSIARQSLDKSRAKSADSPRNVINLSLYPDIGAQKTYRFRSEFGFPIFWVFGF